MTLTTTRELFLRNTRNNDQLIKALLVQLRELAFLTYQREGDADTFIVERTLQWATHSTVYVVTEDTDILILLFHHWDNSKNDVFFNTEKKLKSANMNEWWDLEFFKEGDASDWMDDILFAHALVVAQHELFIAKVSYFTYFLRLSYMSPMKNWTPTLEQQNFFSYRSIQHFNLLFHTKCYLDANNDFSWSYWV